MRIASALRLSAATWPAFAVMGSLWGAFAALVPQIKAGLGAGDAAFGMALFCSALGLMTSMWLAPRIDRRFGPRAMPLAAAMLALAFLTPGLAVGLVAFAVAMALCGLCSGALDVVMNARVSEMEAREDASLMNLNHAMFSLAYMLAAIWGGIGRELGLHAFAVLLPLSIVGVLATRVMRQEVAPVPEAEPGDVARYPWPVAIWGGLIVLFAFMAENASEGWSALHLERTLGGRAAEGALGPTLLGLTMFAGRMGGQVMSDRFRPRHVLLVAALLSASGAGLAAVAPTITLAYAGFASLGLGISVMAPMALAMVGRQVAPRFRTQTIARVAVIGFAGFFLAPPIMGALAETFSLRVSFGVLAAALLCVPVLVAGLIRAGGRYQTSSRSQSVP